MSRTILGVQDHPCPRRYLDTFTLLPLLAARTSRIGLFPDVANLPLRQPAVLAKAAASLDLMSDGRFELGLGAGTFWDAIWAIGGPRRPPGEAVEAIDDAIEVIRRMWSGGRGLRHDGRSSAAPPGPETTEEAAASARARQPGCAVGDAIYPVRRLSYSSPSDERCVDRAGIDRRQQT